LTRKSRAEVATARVLPVSLRDASGSSLIEHHHYLGYEQPVGEQLKYLVSAAGRPLACLAWSSAPRHIRGRDRYIGWSAEARQRNIRYVAYNTRILILPWVRIPHLASHLLSRVTARLSIDWERVYGHPICLAETFVDTERFRGTCYRAAKWVLVGRTTGRGKDDQTHRVNRSIKDVLALPLHRRFRDLLGDLQRFRPVAELASGGRSTRRLPNWLLTKVDEMTDLMLLDQIFPGGRPRTGQGASVAPVDGRWPTSGTGRR
jgi:Druantia protein DruA